MQHPSRNAPSLARWPCEHPDDETRAAPFDHVARDVLVHKIAPLSVHKVKKDNHWFMRTEPSGIGETLNPMLQISLSSSSGKEYDDHRRVKDCTSNPLHATLRVRL